MLVVVYLQGKINSRIHDNEISNTVFDDLMKYDIIKAYYLSIVDPDKKLRCAEHIIRYHYDEIEQLNELRTQLHYLMDAKRKT